MYVIRFADHTYYQDRGGNDWCRANTPSEATQFDDLLDAQAAVIPAMGHCVVCDWDGCNADPVGTYVHYRGY